MLSQNVISIDFGSKYIKIVEGKQQGNGVMIEKAVSIPTPINALKDGKILDMESIKKCISETIQQERIRSKRAVLTIKSTAVITRDIVMPSVKKDQLEAMVKMEIARYLPIMLNEYITEYRVMEEFVEDNIKKLKLLVVALPKSMAEAYLELLGELHLKPVALDINANAISKLFTHGISINDENFSFDQTVSIIDIGHTYINVNIMSKGAIQFSRLITIGSSDIDISLINSFNLSPEQAEETKINQCNLYMSSDLTSEEAMINDEIKTVIDNWIKEIQRIFQYYITRDTGNSVDKILIYGASSRLNGLAEYFRISLNIPTIRLKSVSTVKAGRLTGNIEMDSFLDTVGAIIRR